MQRNPSQTPADLALPSRFICSKLPPLTHVANLLSVGFFIYLETAEQILSQCSLSQLLWLPARGFIPAEGPCSLLAGIRGCRINRGFILRSVPSTPKLTEPLSSHPARLSGPALPPDSPAKNPLFGQEENVWKWSTRFAQGGKAALEEPDPGQQRCCSEGFAAVKRSKMDWKGKKSFGFVCRT